MMRSILFVSGDSTRKFAKSLGTAADALVLDLEDSVATSEKEAARATVAGMLGADRAGKALIVRVNALDTGLTLPDLAAVMPGRPDGILLPKSRGGSDIAEVADYLSAFEAGFGHAIGSTWIMAVATETAEAVLGLPSYTPAHPRLKGLLWICRPRSVPRRTATGPRFQGPSFWPVTCACWRPPRRASWRSIPSAPRSATLTMWPKRRAPPAATGSRPRW